MRLHSSTAGKLNWLLLPGGPGLGSESLRELADVLDVPGSVWLVDLPGDGSNPPRDGRDPFADWPQVLVEAAQAVTDVVFVGHSTGGMYLLATPQLHGLIRGLVLLDTAADCSWHAQFAAMTQQHPLPAFDQAAAAYQLEPSATNLMRLAVASAEWNFPPQSLNAGRALLARLPYNGDAVAWSEAHFDHTYKAAWWPVDIPLLRLWGECDRIVSQQSWDADEYATSNVMTRVIPGAGHFPWIDHPVAVTNAFHEYVEALLHCGKTAVSSGKLDSEGDNG
ncbi:alpha/beta hydrolase [Rhodanobacter sp. AS-Z3]|uniref:alpha/beta fold hydrolase n=1 Tax=Rhodanobacter sp. AS-Z3 TaxID=3031330 RepID=UPI00247A943A|nr:alpha/beta hydrolase [Rhodanobacter sp. AS-Z3]WEN14278.1 alpha/beta hydrolase [Rhodanobacter sp. AS-Z3]